MTATNPQSPAFPQPEAAEPVAEEWIQALWNEATGGSIVSDDMKAFARTVWDVAIAAQTAWAQGEASDPMPGLWDVFNTGANVASGLTFAEAADYMTPERVARGWTLVCVINTQEQLDAALIDPPAGFDAAFNRALMKGPASSAAQVAVPEPKGWRSALEFYASRCHFTVDENDTAWDTVSGEPANFWCDEAGTATVEDGTVAAMALAGTPLPDDDEDAAPVTQVSKGERE